MSCAPPKTKKHRPAPPPPLSLEEAHSVVKIKALIEDVSDAQLAVDAAKKQLTGVSLKERVYSDGLEVGIGQVPSMFGAPDYRARNVTNKTKEALAETMTQLQELCDDTYNSTADMFAACETLKKAELALAQATAALREQCAKPGQKETALLVAHVTLDAMDQMYQKFERFYQESAAEAAANLLVEQKGDTMFWFERQAPAAYARMQLMSEEEKTVEMAKWAQYNTRCKQQKDDVEVWELMGGEETDPTRLQRPVTPVYDAE